MHYKSAYGGDYLKQEHLPDGQDVSLQIEGVELAEFTDEKTNKKKTQLVLSFTGQEKKLGLCRTNADQIAAMYGDETDAWLGAWITLFVDPNVTFGSKRTGGIRIRPMPPQQVQAVNQQSVIQSTAVPNQVLGGQVAASHYAAPGPATAGASQTPQL